MKTIYRHKDGREFQSDLERDETYIKFYLYGEAELSPQNSEDWAGWLKENNTPAHTPEPWRIEKAPQGWGGSTVMFGPQPNTEHTNSIMHELHPCNTTLANWERAVACVNALAGIEKPAEYITRCREIVSDSTQRYSHSTLAVKHVRALIEVANKYRAAQDKNALSRTQDFTMSEEIRNAMLFVSKTLKEIDNGAEGKYTATIQFTNPVHAYPTEYIEAMFQLHSAKEVYRLRAIMANLVCYAKNYNEKSPDIVTTSLVNYVEEYLANAKTVTDSIPQHITQPWPDMLSVENAGTRSGTYTRLPGMDILNAYLKWVNDNYDDVPGKPNQWRKKKSPDSPILTAEQIHEAFIHDTTAKEGTNE